MVPLWMYLVVAAGMFCIGVYGVLARRNAVAILMSVELMLSAVNINLIAFWRYGAADGDGGAGVRGVCVRHRRCRSVGRAGDHHLDLSQPSFGDRRRREFVEGLVEKRRVVGAGFKPAPTDENTVALL